MNRKSSMRPRYERALNCRLSRVPAIDAVFISKEDGGLIHVYSVVSEYYDDLYVRLLKQERLIEREFPQVPFEFHTRAHQGREPTRAVPFGSQPLFAR